MLYMTSVSSEASRVAPLNTPPPDAASDIFSAFFKWQCQPSLQHSSSHWRNGIIDDIKQSDRILCIGIIQLQVTDGKPVHPYILFFGNTSNIGNMMIVGDAVFLQDNKELRRPQLPLLQDVPPQNLLMIWS